MHVGAVILGCCDWCGRQGSLVVVECADCGERVGVCRVDCRRAWTDAGVCAGIGELGPARVDPLARRFHGASSA